MRKYAVLALALTLGLCVTAALAVTNGNFETGDTTGWVADVDGTSGLSGGAFDTRYGVAGVGNYSLGMGRYGTAYDGPQASWYSQTITGLTASTEYTVTVSGKALAFMTEEYIDGNWWGVGAKVALFNGAGPGAGDHNVNPDDWGTLGKVGGYTQWLQHSYFSGEYDENDEEIWIDVNDNGIWRDFSFTTTFTTETNDYATLVLGIHDKVGLDWGPGEDPPFGLGSELAAFDNIVVTVPEPGSIVTLLSGLVGFVCIARRRK